MPAVPAVTDTPTDEPEPESDAGQEEDDTESILASYYETENSSTRPILITIIVILSLLLCVVGGYLYYDRIYLPQKEALKAPTQTVLTPYNGHYVLDGVIARKWTFDMELNIHEGTVEGRFIVRNNNVGYVTLRGTIDANGAMEIWEHDQQTDNLTGYYFTGQLDGDSYNGQYLYTKKNNNMQFVANVKSKITE